MKWILETFLPFMFRKGNIFLTDFVHESGRTASNINLINRAIFQKIINGAGTGGMSSYSIMSSKRSFCQISYDSAWTSSYDLKTIAPNTFISTITFKKFIKIYKSAWNEDWKIISKSVSISQHRQLKSYSNEIEYGN